MQLLLMMPMLPDTGSWGIWIQKTFSLRPFQHLPQVNNDIIQHDTDDSPDISCSAHLARSQSTRCTDEQYAVKQALQRVPNVVLVEFLLIFATRRSDAVNNSAAMTTVNAKHIHIVHD